MKAIVVLCLLAGSALCRVAEEPVNFPEDEGFPMEMQDMAEDVAEPRLECGQAPLNYQFRIVNGSVTPNQGAYPFMVNVLYNGGHRCGAAVYDKFHVISAAHCYQSIDKSKLMLIFGDYDQFTDEAGTQRRTVTKVILHENWKQQGLLNDIAILRVKSELKFGDKVQPICMPSLKPSHGQDAYVLGWGTTNGTGSNRKLRMAKVPIIGRSQCTDKKAGVPGWYTTSALKTYMLCAGYEQGRIDACNGDSGGPLVQYKEESSRFELAGVVSWGIPCALPKKPTVYTSVYDFKSWIVSKIGSPVY